MVDLGACVERLSPQVAYLAARGLAIRFVDAGGSTRAFLERAAEAAPGCDVVIVHAPASELCRMFAHRRRIESTLAGADLPCPIVVADDRPPSVTHAYASMKLLAQRAGLVVSELLLGAAPHSPRAERIAAKLAGCADTFFAGVLRDWAWIDPAGDPCDAPGGDLRRLVAARFENDAAIGASSPTSGKPSRRMGGPMKSGATMYTAKGQLDLNSTLKQYSGLVRRLAHQMIAKLPANVEIDDLIQAGMIGLIDALSRFDEAQGIQFETFATQRIRGAMLDELRENDWLPRSTRKSQREIEPAMHKLEQQLGRAPHRERDRRGDGHAARRIPGDAAEVRGTQLVYLEDCRAPTTTTTSSTATCRRPRQPVRAAAGRSASARRWSRRSRTCPSASST